MTMRSSFRVVAHVAEGSYTREYSQSLIDSDSQVPKLAFKQYIPLDNSHPKEGDVTIIAGHANGIPKETYEPLWEEILARSNARGFKIRAIWIADFFNQGASGVLNENILGNDPCWSDHARDLLYFINCHRHEMPQPLVGIGHSLGASQLVHLAVIHPALFKSLVFIEPGFHATNPGLKAAAPTLKRRDRWPSREAAAREFKASKFYGIWDIRCLNLFVDYGLREVPNFHHGDSKGGGEAEVALTTSKHQELATLMRPVENMKEVTEVDEMFNRPEAITLFQRLPELRPPVLYLFGEKSGPWSASKIEITSTTGTALMGNGGQKAGNVETQSVEGGTHFVPLEKVGQCAEIIAGFLSRRIHRWQRETNYLQNNWRKRPREEQILADEKIRRIIDTPSKGKL